MDTIHFPEASLRNYHPKHRKIPDQRRSATQNTEANVACVKIGLVTLKCLSVPSVRPIDLSEIRYKSFEPNTDEYLRVLCKLVQGKLYFSSGRKKHHIDVCTVKASASFK